MPEPARFQDNPDYVAYVRLLLELQGLMARGEGESDRAEAVRDEATAHWDRLGPHEQAQARGLSADLYMLEGEEAYRQATPEEREPRRLSARLAAAWDRQDWEEVLAILRLGTEFLTPDQVALLRFLGWYELGHDDAALLFLEHASRLSPQNPHYRLMTLHFQRMRALRSEMEALGSAMETQLTNLKPLLAELGLPIPDPERLGDSLKELLTRLRDPTDDPILKLEDARIRESLSRAS
jgi:hypothetical protein